MSTRPLRLTFVLGTRPEVVKLAPLILAARSRPGQFRIEVVSTGQHREMLTAMFRWFDITPDVDLDILRPDQSIDYITRAALAGVSGWLEAHPADWVLVQGDTSTAFSGALAAFYHKIPVAHVEAGLRTWDRYSPFPEEMNRRLITQLAQLHCAPTPLAVSNLRREGVEEKDIAVTGNTGIDSLLWTARKLGVEGIGAGSRRILVTTHRRENHGAPLRNICQAFLEILDSYPDARIQFPVHMSPRVRDVVMPALGGHPRVELSDPLGYPEFVKAMAEADIILTDSGGVQEEAPSLNKPVLVLRESTERQEAVDAGLARLVGSSREDIVREVKKLFEREQDSRPNLAARNPFGDGHAAERILQGLCTYGQPE
ncbi:MAG: UDP-N-acetylglucosamine 2-epimerase (non-hydrolyzing) [Steroidobacteraceae bacterium]